MLIDKLKFNLNKSILYNYNISVAKPTTVARANVISLFFCSAHDHMLQYMSVIYCLYNYISKNGFSSDHARDL